jgi:transcriptional regulator with XRE-family HTH domain
MGSLERPVDRGTRLARSSLARIGEEIRLARHDRGLSQAIVARACGISHSEVSRIERGMIRGASLVNLGALCGAVGLDLSMRTYQGGSPLRDAPQSALLSRFRTLLHRSIGWAVEVPVGGRGDQRSWDAVVSGVGPAWGASNEGPRWRYGVEAETGPRDAQALLRRNQLKLRDSGLAGFLLVLPETRRAREFHRAAQVELSAVLPVDGRRAVELLRAGVDPGGSAVIFVPHSRATRPNGP